MLCTTKVKIWVSVYVLFLEKKKDLRFNVSYIYPTSQKHVLFQYIQSWIAVWIAYRMSESVVRK